MKPVILLFFLLFVNPLWAQNKWYRDADNDGWGNPNVYQLSATIPVGYVQNKFDCNDNSFNTPTWQPVGMPGFSFGAATQTTLIIDGNNTPYVAYCDGAYGQKVSVMKYNGNSWVYVGTPGFSTGGAISMAMTVDGSGTLYVAYVDGSNNSKAVVMKYNGSNWVHVGDPNGFSAGATNYISIAINQPGRPYVAYKDLVNNGKATVMKFNGTSWNSVGNVGFSNGGVQFISIAVTDLDTPCVVFGDASINNWPRAMKYNGVSWSMYGTGFQTNNSSYFTSIVLDENDIPYVVYSLNGNMFIYKFTTTYWKPVGMTLYNGGSNTTLGIARGSIPYIAFQGGNNLSANVKKYDGINWVSVGNVDFSTAQAYYPSISIDTNGIPYVAYQDGINGKVTVQTIKPEPSLPVAPVIKVTANPIPKGDSTTLHMIYASLHDATEWEWYTGSCGGIFLDTGLSITVTPSVTTTYYLRAEGKCLLQLGDCDSFTIKVLPLSVEDGKVSISRLKIIPNPNRGTFLLAGSIDANLTEVKIDIINTLGELFYTKMVPVTNGVLNEPIQFKNEILPGIYTVKVIGGKYFTTINYIVK